MESPRVQRGYLHKLIRQCAAPVVGLVCLSVKDKAVLGRSLDSVMGRMVRNNKGSRLHRNLEMEAQGSSKRIKEKKLQDMCGWCLRSLPSDQALLCSRCQVVYYCDKRHQGRAWELHRKVCGKLGKAGVDRQKNILAKHMREIREANM